MANESKRTKETWSPTLIHLFDLEKVKYNFLTIEYPNNSTTLYPKNLVACANISKAKSPPWLS
jgi:hypothetical protein